MRTHVDPPIGRILAAIATALAAVFLLLGNTCNGTPDVVGDLNVNITRATATAGELCPITRIHIDVIPVAVPPRSDGSTVGTKPIDQWVSVSGGNSSTAGGTPQFPNVCHHSQAFSPLAPGTWAVTGKAVKGNARTCNVTVTAGGTASVTFIVNEGGTVESCF